MGKQNIKNDTVKDHWVDLKGKDYIQYPGLLAEFHRLCDEYMAEHPEAEDKRSIEATLLQIPTAENGKVAIVTATATLSSGARFTEIGDSDPNNTNKMVASAAMRMAATRAKGRALRDATNIGVTMFEELDSFDGNHVSGGNAPQAQNHREAVRPASKNQLDEIKALATDLGEPVVVPSDVDEPGARALIAELTAKVKNLHASTYQEVAALIPQYAKASGKKDADVVAALKLTAKIDEDKKLGEGSLPQLRKALGSLQSMMASEAA